MINCVINYYAGLIIIGRGRHDLLSKFDCLNKNKEGKISTVAEYMYHFNAQKPT
jgi:hypothetical protein